MRGWCGRGNTGVSKRKHRFVKHNIPGNIDAISRNMQTFIAFVKRAVPKKNTLLGAKLKLTIIVRGKMRPARTTKNFKK
jgi:hypothetical protein